MLCVVDYVLFFFFKQKTAYEMRISDWSSDVCSSDLHSGSKATMTVRVDGSGRAVHDGPQVEIGGNERYISVSRAEFKKIVRGEGRIEPLQERLPRSEERRVGKECVIRVDLGGRRIIKQK